MSNMYIDYGELKRKIRKLKQLEIKIRFGSDPTNKKLPKSSEMRLIWDEFFDLHADCTREVKYRIQKLAEMSRYEFKNVVHEYFFNVYFRYYKENGVFYLNLYDPELLAQLGIPYDADISDIKKRFRELAKKLHPDNGGDSSEFMKLVDRFDGLLH